jgi:CheY-like chemotaxis protein
LLGFSRQTILQPRLIDPNAVVTQITNLLKRLIGEDVCLSTALDPQVSRVKADPSQLDQVLMNLAVNARDAMPTGGKLTITTSNVLIRSEQAAKYMLSKPGEYVLLAMSDTGVGMTPKVLARIFEPFYTTKEVGHGTGHGLAMVFGIVQQSGGFIHVESQPGAGSTFQIYLPAVSAVLPEQRATVPKGKLSGTETILLVEDEEAVRGLILRSLQRHGYHVLAAQDGQEALRVATAHQGALDLILTDVVMPLLSGPELAQQVHAAYPQAKLLFMSGYTDDAVVRHGLNEAEMAFIQKPFSPENLVQKVRQVLDERVPAAPLG